MGGHYGGETMYDLQDGLGNIAIGVQTMKGGNSTGQSLRI